MTTTPAAVPSAPGAASLPPEDSGSAAWRLLEDHPTAMLQADEHGAVTWLNAAARACLELPAGTRPGLALLGIDDATARAAGPATLDTPGLRVALGPLTEGRRLITVTPIADLQEAGERARHLGDLLDMAQDFGRLGVWERDIATMGGRWDRHVYRFWGLDPELETPDFEKATLAVMPEDRAATQQAFRDSLQRAGAYSHRYRVRRTDGSIRQLHSQWVVKNGPDGQPARVLGIMMDDTESWELAQSHDTVMVQLRAAVELGRIGVWRQDIATGIVQNNATGFGMLGLEPKPGGVHVEVLREHVHPDDLDRVRATAARALTSFDPVDIEARYQRPDGQWRTVLTRRVTQRDAHGVPVAFTGVSLDMTEDREATCRIEAMSRRFELATRTAGIGYWSQEHGAQRARWSDQLYALHGLAPGDEVPTQPEWLARFVHPEDRDAVRQSFRDWMHSGRPMCELNFRLVRTDGAVVDVISHARVEGSDAAPLQFGIVVDVTERRAAELMLRQAGARAALVAQGVGLGTWEHDMVTGVSHWDEQMWRVRGLEPRSEVMPPEERLAIVHPEDREAAERMLERSNTTALPVNYEFRVRWPDGSWHWLASRSVAVRDSAGRAIRRIGVNWDISEARSAVIAREEKATAQREVQAKSRFMSRMSHELRTPLNAVLGFTQLLMSEGERGGTAARLRRLEHIRSAGRHLLSLIDDVLDLSRLEGGEVNIAMTPTALRPLVADLLPLLEPLAQQQGVQFFSGELDVTPLADPTRLRQVLLNLLTNAVKYNRHGGKVTVDAELRDGVVLIRVADTGHGLTVEQQRHLFEPFNRLGAEGSGIEGTGIGLAIVKALVERMGGTVEVLSGAGLGSTFILRLGDGTHAPVVDEAAASPQSLALAATAGRVGEGGTVLYIEDNPVNAMIVSELLARRADLSLHIAVDGTSGLAMATRIRPDLILLDMQLPDIDGHEVFARLQTTPATARIPCIALSANAMPADIDRALRAGFSDYWTKPLDFRAFMASIDALFGPDPAP